MTVLSACRRAGLVLTQLLLCSAAAGAQGLANQTLPGQLRGQADLGDIAMVLQPKFTTGKQAGVVFIIGCSISEQAYAPMLTAIQDAAAKHGISLWAGAPTYLGNLPQPIDLPQRVSDTVSRMNKAGLPSGAPIFHAAHSLGTIVLQGWVKDNAAASAGQILMGGFILRKSFTPTLSYPVPTLTLAAELDGLARITRMAESWFHQQSNLKNFPVVVLPGQNHMQFASGTPPSNVKNNDLHPEVSEDQAHAAIGSAAADFIAQRLGMGALVGADARAAERAAAAADLFGPIIKAYQMEGSRRFGSPSQIGGVDEKATCVRGLCKDHSPWAPTAQTLISQDPVKAAGKSLSVSNAYVLLAGSPVTGEDFHLPAVTSSGGTVSITTYSQCYWNDALDEVKEDFDTGFTFTSAQEIGTKLLSRQCTQNVGLGQSVDFSVDDPEFCKMTNQMAIDWAKQNAPAGSLARFQQKGIQLTLGDDVQKDGGPLWLEARVQFNKKTGSFGQPIVEVVSPAAKTEQDYWKKHFPFPRPSSVPDPGCYHYCKLLSPARVMEWMLVDGLRTGPLTEQIVV